MLNIRRNFRAKKGFVLIEILCSISVFAILFNTALHIQLNTYNIKKHNEKVINYTYEMKYIKDSMIYSMGYEDILKLWNSGKKYIGLKNISDYDYEGTDVMNLFSDKNFGSEYIQMEIECGEVLKIHLKLNADIYGTQSLEECEFYKGNFKR
ncbi:type II secretion system protein [Clostridium sp. LBM24168]